MAIAHRQNIIDIEKKKKIGKNNKKIYLMDWRGTGTTHISTTHRPTLKK